MKSIKIICSLFLTLLFLNHAYSQVTQEWASTYDGLGKTTDIPAAMVSDGLGNIIVTGRTVASAPTSNFCTVKYNSGGAQQWAAIYNGPENNNDQALCLAADASGNIYVAGIALNAISDHDIVLVKYNPAGIQQWVQSWTGAGNYRDMPYAITIDLSGNIYMTGQSETLTSVNYITLKYNTGGMFQWARQHSSGEANCIETDASGNVYVTGQLISSHLDFLTIKYNPLGDSLWVRRYGTTASQEYPAALAVDINGNCCITGTKLTGTNDLSFLTLKYDPNGNLQWAAINDSGEAAEDLEVDVLGNVYITGGTNVGGSSNIATIKYNTAGIHQWFVIYDYLPEDLGDHVNDMELDAFGNIYITGEISKANGTDHDIITIKYNNSGVQQWAAQYDVTNFEAAFDLVLDADNNVYLTGSQESGGNTDYITIKYSHTVGIHQISNEVPERFILEQNYPNPFNPITNLKFGISNSGFASLKVYNILGNEIETLVNEKISAGSYSVEWDASNHTSGTYFYKLETENFTDVKRMILVK